MLKHIVAVGLALSLIGCSAPGSAKAVHPMIEYNQKIAATINPLWSPSDSTATDAVVEIVVSRDGSKKVSLIQPSTSDDANVDAVGISSAVLFPPLPMEYPRDTYVIRYTFGN